MTLSSLSLLTIANRGWADKREVRVGNISASWPVSQPGKLSAMMSSRDAWLLGIDDFLGLWVRWDHPTMGIWGGRVDDVVINIGQGTVELSCSSFISALKDRITRRNYKQVSSAPGSLVRRAFSDLAVNDLPFTSYGVDTDGDPVSIQWRFDNLYTVVSQLANAGNKQFHSTLADDWGISFLFRQQVGEDKSGDILISEGYQIADGSIPTSLAGLVNTITATTAETSTKFAPTAVSRNAQSAQLRGTRQATRRYYGLTSPAALRTRARIELETISVPKIPVTLRMSDRDPQLPEIREGDTIRAWVASANAQYVVSLTGRAIDADNGVAVLVGTAEVDT